MRPTDQPLLAAVLLTALAAAGVASASAAAAAVPSDVCNAVSAAYVSKGGPDVLHVQYQPSAGHLRVCTQSRPTCCGRPMEDWLQTKAKAELYQMLYQQLVPRSTALASLVTSLQSLFLHMLNVSHQDLDMNLKSIYGYSYIENKQPFTIFFDQLRAYMKGGPDTVADVTRSLFENIAARVYVLIMTNYDIGEQYLACVKQQLAVLRPLGQVPDRVGQEFTRAFVTARRFLLGLAALREAVQSAPTIRLTDQCQKARLRAQYCAWCDGQAGVQPCYGLCAKVMADCLAPLDPLAEPFDQLVGELARLADKVEGANNLYQVLHQLGLRISGGIMDMQERKENFQTQVAKACGQPRLKAGGPVAAPAGLPPMPPRQVPGATHRRSRRRRRRSADMFGWEYRGKDEPVAKGDQQERLTQLVRVARQELTSLRSLFRWDRLARTNCQADPAPPSRCWNGTDPVTAYSPPALSGSDPAAAPPDAATAERARNLRAANQLAAELPRSDNFVEFREGRLDDTLGRLLKRPAIGAGGGGGGAPAVITDALPTGSALAGSGSGIAPPPQPPRRRPQELPPGGVRPTPLVLSTLPPRLQTPPPQPPQQPRQPQPKQPDPDAETDMSPAGSGDSSPPPPLPQRPTPVAPVVITSRPTPPPKPTAAPTTTPPLAPTQKTQPPPQLPIDLEGSGSGRPPSEGPPPAVPPTPGSGGPIAPGPGPAVPPDGASGTGEPTEVPPQPPQPSRQPPSQQPPVGPDEPSGPSGDVQPPLPPDGRSQWTQRPPLPPGPPTAWPPLPPPQPELPGTPQQPPPPQPPPQQPDPGADLWLPKENQEQGGAEKNHGEGSIHSPMKMTEAKRSCPPGSATCPACRPVAAASACALLLLAGLLQRLPTLLLLQS